jgi:uncharacterized RDD family membrane protein YckC
MATTGEAKLPANAHAAVLPYAGFQIRTVAFLLDCVVVVSFALLFFTIAFLPVALGGDSKVSSGEEQWALAVAVVFLPFVLFLFFILWALRGQSLGMMAVRIEVTDRDGEPLAAGRAAVRTIVWPFSMLALGLGAIPVLFDDERRALHDMVAGTVVLELP